jgi:hypothetical protein
LGIVGDPAGLTGRCTTTHQASLPRQRRLFRWGAKPTPNNAKAPLGGADPFIMAKAQPPKRKCPRERGHDEPLMVPT